jgi:hypothetical protein
MAETPEITTDMLPMWTSGEMFKDGENARHLRLLFGGHVYEIRVEKNTISFPGCIDIDIDPYAVYLRNYYLGGAIRHCPKIPHEIFFALLKELGNVYQKEVSLVDMSSKTFDNTNCGRIYSEIFALAGLRTFYERFGFENGTFSERIERLQTMTLEELLSYRNKRHSERLDKERIKAVRLLSHFGMDLSITVESFAAFLVDACKRAERHNFEYDRREKKGTRATRGFDHRHETASHGVLIEWFFKVLRELKRDVGVYGEKWFTMKGGRKRRKLSRKINLSTKKR